jgi:hypothetical protein
LSLSVKEQNSTEKENEVPNHIHLNYRNLQYESRNLHK